VLNSRLKSRCASVHPCAGLGAEGGNRSKGLPDHARRCLLNSRTPVNVRNQCAGMLASASGLLQELLPKDSSETWISPSLASTRGSF
jgi:hypothetical protein